MFYTCLSFSSRGVYPSMQWGAHPLDTPPETAVEASGMHPTGMHSCFVCNHFDSPLYHGNHKMS